MPIFYQPVDRIAAVADQPHVDKRNIRGRPSAYIDAGGDERTRPLRRS
jgi:hypothetical protein